MTENKIIKFDKNRKRKKRKEPEPSLPEVSNLEGPAECLHCRKVFMAIAPVGHVFIKCPDCHVEKAVFRTHVLPEESEEILLCTCGSWVWSVTKSTLVCVICGMGQPYKVK